MIGLGYQIRIYRIYLLNSIKLSLAVSENIGGIDPSPPPLSTFAVWLGRKIQLQKARKEKKRSQDKRKMMILGHRTMCCKYRS